MPQGRSKESRLRKFKRDQEYLKTRGSEFVCEILLPNNVTIYLPKSNQNQNYNRCRECLTTTLIFCSREGETVCTECGLVQEQIYQDEVTVTPRSLSKKYNRIVHFRERTAAWQNTGPMIPNEHFELIEDYYFQLKYLIPNRHLLGRSLLTSICDKLGLSAKKYGERWIQARIRLNLKDDWYPPSHSLVSELHTRFFLMNMAFQYCIHISSTSDVPVCAKRRNIIPLNYIILQLIRLINEEEFQHWKRYFTISNLKTLQIYNYYWSIMINWIIQNQSIFINRDTDQNVAYYWVFTPLFEFDLYIPPELEFI